MKRLVPFLVLLLICLTACQPKKTDSVEDTAISTSYIDSSDKLYGKWQKNFRYAFVASDTSTLMMAGFSLEGNQEVQLYRSGSELMAWNQGKIVRGTFRLKSYDKKETVETYLILDAKTTTGTEPERIKVLPDLVVQIDVSEAELQKADPERKGDEKTTFYAYQTRDGILVLTNGKTDEDLQVFIAFNDAVQTSSSVFPDTMLGTWYGWEPSSQTTFARTFYEDGRVEKRGSNGRIDVAYVKRMVPIETIPHLYHYILDTDKENSIFAVYDGFGDIFTPKVEYGIFVHPEGKFLNSIVWGLKEDEEFNYRPDPSFFQGYVQHSYSMIRNKEQLLTSDLNNGLMHLWSRNQPQELATFMASFGERMGQSPYNLIHQSEHILYNENQLEVSYNLLIPKDYTIVATYEYIIDQSTVHRYYFAIREDQTATVLYTNVRDASLYYVKTTENQELLQGFSEIVNLPISSERLVEQ